MTRILLIPLLLFSYCITNAQFKKNDILLGGALGYSHSSSPNIQYPNLTADYGIFNVSAGKAVSEHAVFGVNLNFSPSWSSEYFNYGLGPLAYTNYGYGISIFYRKYKGLGKDFYFFTETGAGYAGSTQTGKDSAEKKVISGYSSSVSIYLTPGFAYRVSNKLFLEIAVPNIFYANYFSQSISVQDVIPFENKNNSFNINTSLSTFSFYSFNFGFRFIL
jgi:hypothetical protein